MKKILRDVLYILHYAYQTLFELPKRVILKVMECFILGFQHVESTVTALVDIIHAFAIADPSKVGLAVKQYVKMLLCEVCGSI